MLGAVKVKSELEIGKMYSDILLTPKEKIEERYSILIEFKYIKNEEYKKDKNILKEKQEEAKNQIMKYKNTEELKNIKKLNCYTVVAVLNELYVEKID